MCVCLTILSILLLVEEILNTICVPNSYRAQNIAALTPPTEPLAAALEEVTDQIYEHLDQGMPNSVTVTVTDCIYVMYTCHLLLVIFKRFISR